MFLSLSLSPSFSQCKIRDITNIHSTPVNEHTQLLFQPCQSLSTTFNIVFQSLHSHTMQHPTTDMECTQDEDCSYDKTCMSGQCTNMCDKSHKCSKYATCIVVQHQPMCICKPCYHGNGTACTEDTSCKICLTNKHCKSGQVCMNNRCEVSCKSGEDCKSGEKCIQGVCKSSSNICTSNTECNEQQTCVEGICENLFCSSDTECSLDQICKNNMCVDTVCNGDLNCLAGQMCTEEGICRTKPATQDKKDEIVCKMDQECNSQQTCVDGKCKNSMCEQDSDCGETELCKDNKCVPKICRSDFNCGNGQFCNDDGLCALKACTADIHCKKNETCIEFICKDKHENDASSGSTDVHCKDTKDCRYGEVCRNNICKSNINCKNGTCSRRDTCKYDYECENNGVCNQGLCDYVCTQDSECNKGETCQNGLCKKNTCKQNADCSNRQICEDSVCKNTCRKTTDCKKNVEKCVNNVCRPWQCKSETDCDTNEVCRNSTCLMKTKDNGDVTPENRGGCKTDEDCKQGQLCSKNLNSPGGGQCIDDLCAIVKCERNKICKVQNNRTSCICEHGYTITDIGELKCLDSKRECYTNEDCGQLMCSQGKCVNPCIPNPCAVDKQCTVNAHKAVCLCMDKCSPSASMCFNDKGCPSDQVCRSYACINPCTFTLCLADSSCYVENHVAQCSVQCPDGYRMETAGCVKGKAFQFIHGVN